MKKTLLITVVVALLLGSLTFSAFAFEGKNGGAKGIGFGLKGLNLSADQQQKILAIRQEFEKNTLSLRQEMQQKRQELRQLWSADNLNQAAIDAKTKEVTALRIQMVQKSRDMFAKVKAILTPDQVKQLETQKQKRFQGHRGKMGGSGY